MLTSKQKALFEQLGLSEEHEQEYRKHHKMVKNFGAPHDFTTWLTKCLKAKWRLANTRIYVGD